MVVPIIRQKKGTAPLARIMCTSSSSNDTPSKNNTHTNRYKMGPHHQRYYSNCTTIPHKMIKARSLESLLATLYYTALVSRGLASKYQHPSEPCVLASLSMMLKDSRVILLWQPSASCLWLQVPPNNTSVVFLSSLGCLRPVAALPFPSPSRGTAVCNFLPLPSLVSHRARSGNATRAGEPSTAALAGKGNVVIITNIPVVVHRLQSEARALLLLWARNDACRTRAGEWSA